jgi:hypothetical protein
MASGMWVVLVIPAVIALIFCAWVLYSVIIDVAQRGDSPFTVLGRDKVRINIEPGG